MGRRRYGLSVALTALLPAGLVGWLVWQGTSGGPGGDRAEQPKPAPSSTATERGPDASGEPGASASPGGPSASPTGADRRDDLRGRTVVLDPGHNPNNGKHPDRISRLVDVGNGRKECDTTGTQARSGYTEAEFTLDLARRVQKRLEARGATVRFTHTGRLPWGPCVDDRAEAGNRARADLAISLHADGASPGDRGFHVILPAPVRGDGANTGPIVRQSRRLGEDLVTAFRKATGTAPSNYLGGGKGLDTRDDLGGLNLSTIPKVFLECGNMRDRQDAARLADPEWRERAARGVSDGVATYVTGVR
ncbi:N-acetylmuramoyl-L-alanine amidase [Streptomyces sp. AJS327]|uniref:N-acetylmuramoyl-L-alanine amidase n=1 Tax=Streptomyces sp. AJS327 TaxID=2545265 RepID=UPI0015DDA404|nr:N-acetylmuramoyl-L-alanine amidase [Streptomyces sp. AJS327]MBA0050037.1 N-acetylmuramoyl-L-alanine amidase [Streptomyces sp. AJS327]